MPHRQSSVDYFKSRHFQKNLRPVLKTSGWCGSQLDAQRGPRWLYNGFLTFTWICRFLGRKLFSELKTFFSAKLKLKKLFLLSLATAHFLSYQTYFVAPGAIQPVAIFFLLIRSLFPINRPPRRPFQTSYCMAVALSLLAYGHATCQSSNMSGEFSRVWASLRAVRHQRHHGSSLATW